MVGSILQNFTMKVLRRLNEFQTACTLLVEDMILHQQRKPDEQLRVHRYCFLTLGGTQKMLRKISLQTQEWCHQYVTHYIVNSQITLETLERIQKYTDVQEIIGEHSGWPSSDPENLRFQGCHYR